MNVSTVSMLPYGSLIAIVSVVHEPDRTQQPDRVRIFRDVPPVDAHDVFTGGSTLA